MYPPVALGKVESYVKNVEHIVTSSGASALLISKQVRPILGSVLDTGAVKKLILVESLNLDAPRAGTEPSTSPDDVCFLQYTSGSTSSPKGVVVTHGNLAANCVVIARDGLKTNSDTDHGVSWLPLYHDMGLIGFVIVPLFARINITFLPTMEFVKRPAYWLETIDRQRATITFAPNFAYALCLKRVKDEELEGMDLTSWALALNGAEPVSVEVLRRFSARFARWGLRPEALVPVYGLSEASLAVTFSPPRPTPRALPVDAQVLAAEGRIQPGTRELASVGGPVHGVEICVRDEAGVVGARSP
jgi:acyl-CoA synthetase (AMP-forming)/AMP-acid ligase II